MLAVRVLAACLCLLSSQCTPLHETPATNTTTTTHSLDASAPPGGQDSAAAKPQLECIVQNISASVREDLQPTVIDYTVVVNQPNNCGGAFNLWYCKGNPASIFFNFKESGHYCMKENGSYQLEFMGNKSECFNVSGTKLPAMEVSLGSDKVSVRLQQLPGWAKGLEIWIKDNARQPVYNEKHYETLDIVAPGNYSVNPPYHLWYSPVMKEDEQWKVCSGEAGKHQYFEPLVPPPPPPSPPNPDSKAMVTVGIIAGVCLLVLVACTVKTCIRHRNKPDPGSSDIIPLFPPKTPGDVVLIHAQDNGHLARLCQDLKDTITKRCGRKVVDISLTDAQKQLCPEAWMLNVLSLQNNTVLLVMSPAMVALHRALKQGNDAAGCVAVAEVRGEMHPWDMLLPICLHYLEEHLSQNYVRLLVVRFQQASSSSSRVEDIPELVTATRFLLPQHQSHLQETLKGRSVPV